MKILLFSTIVSVIVLLIGGIMFIINPIWGINIIMNSVVARILLVSALFSALFGAFSISISEN